MASGRILAASQSGVYVLKLVGDVRVNLCTTIDEYLEQMFADPAFVTVSVDLCEAEGLDSTTLGVLARLALRCQQQFGFQPRVYCCQPDVMRLLQSMSLPRIMDLVAQEGPNAQPVSELPVADCALEQAQQHVLEAHRALMALSIDNAARFSELVSALETEI